MYVELDYHGDLIVFSEINGKAVLYIFKDGNIKNKNVITEKDQIIINLKLMDFHDLVEELV